MSKTLTGGCLCGYIRFSAVNPVSPHSCSCDMCQKHTGAQTAVWLEFTAKDVNWTGDGGAPATWRSSQNTCRAFCPRCGSSLGAIDDGPVIALLTGAFDQPDNKTFAPEFHSFEDMKPSWWRQICPDAE
ncbi:GFA family protein [Klebsiella sp. RHBSTW-00215]|uniref:GFA family protein n=1 Tax=Klebsiella sp. RHBSTW-00215 TaxID=2742640 RepID=UPI0015F548CA|nr:GFA family protein [Klebsiella sp. RHBSTW-00215]MBA7934243.1 GFA family protein [Klebsiella sp. RHBSTW-00215]